MSNAPTPALPNGRPWFARIISEQWGPLLLFGMAVGGGGYAVYLIFHLLLTQQAAERADYRKMLSAQQKAHSESQSEQRKVHTEQQNALTTLIIRKVIQALEQNEIAIKTHTELIKTVIPTVNQTSESVIAIRGLSVEMRETQKNFVPLIDRLLKQHTHGIPASGTTPPGRKRPPFEGTGPQ